MGVACCQSIRFHVYCRERGFLSETNYLDEVESDDFDDVATHLAVVEGEGNLLGTARLIRHSSRGFPLQRYCRATVPVEIAPSTAEVSRLAVPRSVAQKYGHAQRADCISRQVATKLYQTIYRVAKREGITHLVAAMAPPLVRILRAFDIRWSAIGPVADFGGLVQPYMVSVGEFDATDSPAARRFRGDKVQ
jgi:N-acyl amino acid synthase of PEP-CTERM/exosortase system